MAGPGEVGGINRRSAVRHRQPRLGFRVPFLSGYLREFDDKLLHKLKDVENEGYKVIFHPKFGNNVYNILHGRNQESHLEKIKIGQSPDTMPFLKALLEFNLSLDEMCGTMGIRSDAYHVYINPGKVLEAMSLTKGDAAYLLELFKRSENYLGFRGYVIRAIGYTFSGNDTVFDGLIKTLLQNIQSDPNAYGYLKESIEYAQSMMKDRKRIEDATAAELQAKQAARAKKLPKEEKKKEDAFPALSGELLEKWQKVEQEGSALIELRGRNLSRRIRRVMKGEDPSGLVTFMGENRDKMFAPFLRAFLEFHMGLTRELYRGFRLFSDARSMGYPSYMNPVNILDSMGLGRKDKDYLLNLSINFFDLSFTDRVLFIIRHNFSANDADVYEFISKQHEYANALGRQNEARAFKIAIATMNDAKKQEDREIMESTILAELDEMRDKES